MQAAGGPCPLGMKSQWHLGTFMEMKVLPSFLFLTTLGFSCQNYPFWLPETDLWDPPTVVVDQGQTRGRTVWCLGHGSPMVQPASRLGMESTLYSGWFWGAWHGPPLINP